VEAARWFKKAAEQGHARAQFNLGTMCERGRGVEQSYVAAAEWYKEAASQGHTDAQLAVFKVLEKAAEKAAQGAARMLHM
jgi:TPR repeat protein